MLIANPISDLVFKWLMSDKRIARLFLEVLLDETIIEIDFRPQELTYHKNNDEGSFVAAIAVIRLDFVATIKTGAGEYKKVLIEIQKARDTTDVMRFRNYLAEQYKKQDEVETKNGKKLAALPIITVYMLGFKLQEMKRPVFHVKRIYIDKETHEIFYEKDDLVEQLTHDCYIVQIPRIEGKVNNRLNQLLSFFEQKYFIDETGVYKDYPYKIENDEMKMILDELHLAGTDPEKQKYLATEKEAMRVYNLKSEEVEEKQREIERKDKEIWEKDNALKRNEKVIEDKIKALEDKNKALEAALKEIEELKKRHNK